MAWLAQNWWWAAQAYLAFVSAVHRLSDMLIKPRWPVAAHHVENTCELLTSFYGFIKKLVNPPTSAPVVGGTTPGASTGGTG